MIHVIKEVNVRNFQRLRQASGTITNDAIEPCKSGAPQIVRTNCASGGQIKL